MAIEHETTLVALRTDTGGQVVIGDSSLDLLRDLSDRRLLRCPHCGGDLTLKAGAVRVHHFAHLNATACAAADHEPENDAHRQGKLLLYHQFRARADFAAVEHHLPATDQRADVFMEVAAHRYALEFQQVNTSWPERHALYRSQGLADLWFLGQVRYGVAEPLHPVPRFDPLPVPRDVYEAAAGVFRVRELEKAILAAEQRLHYLDPASGLLTVLLGRDLPEDLEHRQTLRAYYYRLPLADCDLRDGRLWTPLDPLLEDYLRYLARRGG